MAKKALPADRPRGNITIRVREEVRAAIQREADANGRSWSEEAEVRLERSLLDQHAAIDVLDVVYGQQLNDVLSCLGRVIKSVVEHRPFYLGRSALSWLDYPWKFDEVVKAANFFFERLRPPGEVQLPPQIPIFPPTLLAVDRRATPQERAQIKEIHQRAAEIEFEQAGELGVMIAEREIKTIIEGGSDGSAPLLRDRQVAERLARPQSGGTE